MPDPKGCRSPKDADPQRKLIPKGCLSPKDAVLQGMPASSGPSSSRSIPSSPPAAAVPPCRLGWSWPSHSAGLWDRRVTMTAVAVALPTRLALLWPLCARSHGAVVGTDPISQRGVAAAEAICNGVGVRCMGLERDGLGNGAPVLLHSGKPRRQGVTRSAPSRADGVPGAGWHCCSLCLRARVALCRVVLCASHRRLCATTPASGSALLPRGFARSRLWMPTERGDCWPRGGQLRRCVWPGCGLQGGCWPPARHRALFQRRLLVGTAWLPSSCQPCWAGCRAGGGAAAVTSLPSSAPWWVSLCTSGAATIPTAKPDLGEPRGTVWFAVSVALAKSPSGEVPAGCTSDASA